MPAPLMVLLLLVVLLLVVVVVLLLLLLLLLLGWPLHAGMKVLQCCMGTCAGACMDPTGFAKAAAADSDRGDGLVKYR